MKHTNISYNIYTSIIIQQLSSITMRYGSLAVCRAMRKHRRRWIEKCEYTYIYRWVWVYSNLICQFDFFDQSRLSPHLNFCMAHSGFSVLFFSVVVAYRLFIFSFPCWVVRQPLAIYLFFCECRIVHFSFSSLNRLCIVCSMEYAVCYVPFFAIRLLFKNATNKPTNCKFFFLCSCAISLLLLLMLRLLLCELYIPFCRTLSKIAIMHQHQHIRLYVYIFVECVGSESRAVVHKLNRLVAFN